MPTTLSISQRAAMPIAVIITPRRPMTMPFWDSVSTYSSAWISTRSSRSTISSTWTSTACRTSWRVRWRTCSRTLGEADVLRLVETSSTGTGTALGGSLDRCSSSGGRRGRGWRDRKDLAVQAEVGGGLERLDVRVLSSRSILLTTITTGLRAPQRLGDEAVAGAAGALLAVEHQHCGVGLLELVLDAALHALGEHVARALDAGSR